MGAKVTCFAYGQTGSGKTYTMNGDLGNGVAGLYYLGANDIFSFQSNVYFYKYNRKDFNIWKYKFLFSKFIAVDYLIYWIIGIN